MTKRTAAYGELGEGDPVAPPTGDRPQGWATGPCRPLGGATGPLFFCQGPRCEFEEKKLHLGPVALWGATGEYFWNISKRTYIFEIFIFLKYKKEKSARWRTTSRAPAGLRPRRKALGSRLSSRPPLRSSLAGVGLGVWFCDESTFTNYRINSSDMGTCSLEDIFTATTCMDKYDELQLHSIS